MSDGSCRRRSNSPNNADVASGFAELPPLVGAKVGTEGFGCVSIGLISRGSGDVGVQVTDDHIRAVDEAVRACADIPPDVVAIPVSHARVTEPSQLRHDRRGNDNTPPDLIATPVVPVRVPAVFR